MNSSILEPPLGSYQIIVKCSDCGADVPTHTEADMSDQTIANMVTSAASKMKFYCANCHAKRTPSEIAAVLK